MAAEKTTPIPVLDTCGKLIGRYKVILCDVWGVLYDGTLAYPAAVNVLQKARSDGATVILLSNAARLGDEATALLAEAGVPGDCFDAILTSGQLAHEALVARGSPKVFHIGPERHASIMTAANSQRVSLDTAEVVVCSGFFSDEVVAPETYLPLLAKAQKRGLPMICANPDLVVEVAGQMLACPGALARLYSDLGGSVQLAGKPDICAYDAARTLATTIIGDRPAPSQFLAIGDSVATDMAGAKAAGIAALFVAGGIHRAELIKHGMICRKAAKALFQRETIRPIALCRTLK